MGLILSRQRIPVQMSPILHPGTTPGLGHHLLPHLERNWSGPHHPLHQGEFPLTRCGLLFLHPSYSQPLCRTLAPLLPHPRSSKLRRMLPWGSRLTSGGNREHPVPKEGSRAPPPLTVDQAMLRSDGNPMEIITMPLLCLLRTPPTLDFETQTQRQKE